MAGYAGDIVLGDTIDIKFCTVQTTGAPFTLAGGPVISAYVGNSTTEITAGITLTTDFDARTGLNNVRVVASSGNGFAAATNVSLVITTGTVNGVSVVGYEVGSFSIQNRGISSINGIAATSVTTIKPVIGLTTADTIATYTGNTPQTGDAYARIGLAGVGLTNLGDTRIANLDATVSSRMATYTQPTGFLAATFPTGTVANTTNITAGTITTVTNLTNAPTAGDFTAVMKTSLNAATPASVIGAVGSVTGNVGGNVVGSVASVTAVVSANITKINGTTVNGNGAGTPWGP